MMALGEAVEAAGDIIFVYIDFSNPSTALAPFDHVFRVLPCDVQFEYFKLRKADVAHIPTFRYQWLNEALHRRGRVVLIAVDEFHLLVTSTFLLFCVRYLVGVDSSQRRGGASEQGDDHEGALITGFRLCSCPGLPQLGVPCNFGNCDFEI